MMAIVAIVVMAILLMENSNDGDSYDGYLLIKHLDLHLERDFFTEKGFVVFHRHLGRGGDDIHKRKLPNTTPISMMIMDDDVDDDGDSNLMEVC